MGLFVVQVGLLQTVTRIWQHSYLAQVQLPDYEKIWNSTAEQDQDFRCLILVLVKLSS